jgi:hypothetical protein
VTFLAGSAVEVLQRLSFALAAIFARSPFGKPVAPSCRAATNTWFMFTSQENEAPTKPPTTSVPVQLIEIGIENGMFDATTTPC